MEEDRGSDEAVRGVRGEGEGEGDEEAEEERDEAGVEADLLVSLGPEGSDVDVVAPF